MKNPRIRRMVKAGRAVRGMPHGNRTRRMAPQPAPPHEGARPVTVEDDTADMSTYTVDQLRKMAAQKDVKGRSKMNKSQLIEALS